jgi:hypothetical protein
MRREKNAVGEPCRFGSHFANALPLRGRRPRRCGFSMGVGVEAGAGSDGSIPNHFRNCPRS